MPKAAHKKFSLKRHQKCSMYFKKIAESDERSIQAVIKEALQEYTEHLD